MKYVLFLLDFNENGIFSTDFRNMLKCQFSWQFGQFRVEEQTDMTNLIVPFHNVANVTKNWRCQHVARFGQQKIDVHLFV